VAKKDLFPTPLARLGLALNDTTFHYEVIPHPQETGKMDRNAFEDASVELANVVEDSCNVHTFTMQLLRDNMTCGR